MLCTHDMLCMRAMHVRYACAHILRVLYAGCACRLCMYVHALCLYVWMRVMDVFNDMYVCTGSFVLKRFLCLYVFMYCDLCTLCMLRRLLMVSVCHVWYVCVVCIGMVYNVCMYDMYAMFAMLSFVCMVCMYVCYVCMNARVHV